VQSKQELEILLKRLKQWKKGRDKKNTWNRTHNDYNFEDEALGLDIHECFEHSGVSEWIEAIEFVLDKDKEKRKKVSRQIKELKNLLRRN
jgi:hypothetical protein